METKVPETSLKKGKRDIFNAMNYINNKKHKGTKLFIKIKVIYTCIYIIYIHNMYTKYVHIINIWGGNM